MTHLITICQAGVFISYLAFILIKFKGPLPSISDSWYSLEGVKKHLFTFFCWSIGVMMFMQTNGETGLFFLSGTGLCFVGAATMFRQSLTGQVHAVGAIVAIMGAFAAIFFERGQIIPLLIFGLSILFILPSRNRVFWIEISAFLCILYGLWMQ